MVGINETDVYTCNKCAENWGPLVQENAVNAPYCVKVYSPNEAGEPAECAGKGIYQYGGCQCYTGYSLITFEDVETCG